ncbi:MAG: AAA family ATPase [Kofleriaceae bacterium]
MIVLSPAREVELIAAVAEAFTYEDLERRVMDPMRIPRSVRSGSTATENRIARLVEWATKESRLGELLRVAREANPSSLRLQQLSEALGLSAATSDVVKALGSALTIDPDEWWRSLAETKRQVCRIVVGEVHGTGFLVGPDQVMTHQRVFGAAGDLAAAAARGDAHVIFEPEEVYRSEQLVFASPGGVVVVQVDRSVGREIQQQQTAGTSARARGWISPKPGPAKPSVVMVFHDPEGALAVAADPDGVAMSGRELRLPITAIEGAGAPCFDADLRLIGMHVEAQAGLSLAAILDDLKASGATWSASGGIQHTTSAQPPRSASALDDLLRAVDPSASRDVDDDVWESELEIDDDSWAWAEAAAVSASFDPERLQPLRPASKTSRVAVLLESQPIGSRWMLSEKLRVRALHRLAARGELAAARAANPGAPDDPIDHLLGAYLDGDQPSPADLRDPARLRAILQVVEWLAGVVAPLPDPDELRAALERATLLAPFRHLTRGFFAGREPELAKLAAYVRSPKPAPPLLVHGPGGMGKSALLAHFILAHAEHDPANPAAWRPFVYLDFDRPDLDAVDLAGVLVAIVRQLGPQIPTLATEARALVDRWQARRRAPRRKVAAKSYTPRVDQGEVTKLVTEVAALIDRVDTSVREPIVLVLDTLEEVQYANPDAIGPLVKLVTELRRGARQLRPVLAGRIEPADHAIALDSLPLGPLPPAAAEALLGNQLPPALARRTELVSRMARVVGGNPLSLRLAAEVLRREDTDAILGLEDELWKRVGDAIVQGRLYERILGHVRDPAVRAIAHPGLILRRITWEVIRDVLATPCGLEIRDDDMAKSIFQTLAAEVALVRQGDTADTLELRPELRRIVLDDFRHDAASADKQHRIHEAAIVFYAARFHRTETAEDRAEEIYHRLVLDQDPAEIDRLWVQGIEHALDTALDELPERARTFLANRIGLVADVEVVRTATLEEWERWAERRAGDLLRFGSAVRALEILELRAERMPTSRLHVIESVARRALTDPDLEGALIAATKAVAAARASRDAGALDEALQELVQVNRLRDDTPGLLRALAELGKLGQILGDDLVVLQATVDGLESVGMAETELTDTAVRVFARLPDELVARAPELARRVAAQVGGNDPATLQRVVRLVGTGSPDPVALAELAQILRGWARRSPDIAAFLPDDNLRDLASTTRYLVTNRTLDSAIAGELADWMKHVKA